MKEILKNIIESYFKKWNNKLKSELILENTLLIIKDENWDPSDFFYFIFDYSFSSELWIEDIFKELSGFEFDTKKLSEIDSFDKNLNFVFFIETPDDLNIPENIKKQAYLLEENPYFAKKKVVFYTKEQQEGFTNSLLSIDELLNEKNSMNDWGVKIKDVDVNMKILTNDTNKRFTLNLLIWLSFIRIDFPKWTEDNKDILSKSFASINTKNPILDIKYQLSWDMETFNKEIDKLRIWDYNLSVNCNSLSQFEKDLLNLIGEWRVNIENNLLEYKTIAHENI